MRVVFMGTPDFSVPSLRALLDGHDVRLVISRPDRPAGRGMTLSRSPVASTAEAAGRDLERSDSPGSPEVIERVRQARPEVLVVAAYGRILPPALLEVPE